MRNFFELYMDYVGESESPSIFHRWTSISIVAALLEREFYLPFGHSKIFPSMYIMLMGTPGTRKSTAISIGAKALERIGYEKFAPERTAKEMFLKLLADRGAGDGLDADIDTILNAPVNGSAALYVAADEFTDFVGQNNIEFLIMLGKLWDAPTKYKHPKLRSADVVVHNPIVNMLCGNTPAGMAKAVPPESNDVGFMSRVIFVRGVSTGKKICFPTPPSDEVVGELSERLRQISANVHGIAAVSPGAKELVKEIYEKYVPMEDVRFLHYSTRRQNHLLKLAMVLAAVDISTKIQVKHVLHANTLLHYTEHHMPAALGEYGKAKNSEATNMVLNAIQNAGKPITSKELWKKVSMDLNSIKDLMDITRNLMQADKIRIKDSMFVPIFREVDEWEKHLIDPDFLSEDEKMSR